METANIADFKNNLSKYLTCVEKGQTVRICKRNIPIAVVMPIESTEKKNKTQLGCGQGTVQINTDLTQPLIPIEDWEMLDGEGSS